MNNKSKGLGDSIEKFTKATGIKKAVDTVAKGDQHRLRMWQTKGYSEQDFPIR